ncbi:MAG: CinA family protein [gamma proteobacterium symbiont of Bathyaustriella thionipta]|nr:CinA family protein [gamma proteobacterium symbiont of Bathyaustriella thionipta]MCU7949869.1 CinA family protein [gamma proteobacterium symbiont of Bathyaustriella thionipta]MCU7954949.1 CinA family protein [gamma proteobacterium symbiont of Bathyaustriella thionipta]MCU7956454.1 CinA family protein [gamma proteobacterium symbiont of Bathyaustriella thionipta]MCU7966925.1 CinA family protein [gamma proteobacterium symbiont of Bathyaustriella thionipta]
MIETTLNDLADFCIKSKQLIATAESCTGGLVAKLITDCAGSSQWFERGFVTYSNLSKEQMLGLDEQLINDNGAVSEAVAEAMARGVLEHSQAHYALSVTGIAGPAGGTETKPVGTVCFAWAYYDLVAENLAMEKINCITMTQYFSGDRQAVRTQSAHFSLHKLDEIIKQISV